MTEEQFTELVNLYLDKEISPDQLKKLKAELENDPDRKKAFAERCRLHQAMRMALNPGKSRSSSNGRARRSSGSRRSGRRSGSSGSRPNTRYSRVDEQVQASQPTHFPRWILGSGVAASLLVGLILLPPVFRDTTDAQSQPELVGVTKEELARKDPLDTIGKSELRRFASVQAQREMNQSASLVAQMRLLGLSPELTPDKKELREVSLAAVQPRRRTISQAELLQQIQELRAIPETELIKIEESAPSLPSWSSTFQSSLVSFGE